MLQMLLKNFEEEIDVDNFILNENENSELRNMENREDENDGDSWSLLDVEKIRKKKRNYQWFRCS